MTVDRPAGVRRVVVALHPGSRATRVFREAARVAARFGVELEGVFLEDEDLFKLAGYPFAQSTGAFGTRGFDRAQLEREWRVVEAELRAALEREAAAAKIRAHLEVRRGSPRDAVAGSTGAGDLVFVGWGGWSPRARKSAPVRVLYDGGEAAERALEAGIRLAGPRGQLAIWMVGAPEEAVEVTRERLAGRVGRLRVAAMSDPSVAAVRHILAARPGGLLLVPANSPVANALADRSAEVRFPASVLVVH